MTPDEVEKVRQYLLIKLGSATDAFPASNDLSLRKTSEEIQAAHLQIKKIKKPLITTQLEVKTWIWEKEQSHRLFNFSEGYIELP